MYDVMIVEDELIVRQWFINKVRWEALGLRVIADVANGRDALRAYERSRPHIIMTDLLMPILGGMDLIQEVRKNDALTRFIVVTCLEEFVAAREAIKLGVTGYVLKITSEVEEIETELRKAIHSYEQLKDAEQRESAVHDSELPVKVRAALAIIHKCYAEDISLQSVADKIGVTPSYLGQLMAKHCGLSLVDEINAARIQEAKRLLRDPSLKIFSIAQEVGYQNPNYFYRIFKRITGKTPNEYRNSLDLASES